MATTTIDDKLLSELDIQRTGQLCTLKLDELRIDPSYGRTPVAARVRRMTETWSEPAAGVLMVSHRFQDGGSFYLLDGGHRCAAAKAVGYTQFLCCVYEHLTVAMESDIWTLCNTDRRNPTAMQRYKAALVAGDPDAIGITAAAKKAQCTVPIISPGGQRHPSILMAHGAMLKIYKELGPAHLIKAIEVCREAWPDDRDGTAASMIAGVSNFLGKYPEVNQHTLAQKLRLTRPALILGDAAALSRTFKGSRNVLVARFILDLYNKSRKTQRLTSRFMEL